MIYLSKVALIAFVSLLFAEKHAFGFHIPTPSTSLRNYNSQTALYSTMDKKSSAESTKAAKLAKIEILKTESSSLLQPLKDVSIRLLYNYFKFLHLKPLLWRRTTIPNGNLIHVYYIL